jgi:hypothetical protein
MTWSNSKIICLLIVGLMITACTPPMVLVGAPEPEIDREIVKVFYPQRPNCNFDTIGYILVEGGFYSLNALIEHMQSQAAEVGATGVYVTQTQRLDIKEYIGVATAIRCEET